MNDITEEDAYECPICGENYWDEKREAQLCCHTETDERIIHICGECGIEHDNEKKAQECCLPDAIKIKIYICGECQGGYEEKDEAKECCSKRDEERE